MLPVERANRKFLDGMAIGLTIVLILAIFLSMTSHFHTSAGLVISKSMGSSSDNRGIPTLPHTITAPNSSFPSSSPPLNVKNR
ncbi:MAG: hypothetical protein V1776_02620 [Candidatus Diapherotrites archaeon]